MDVLDAGHPVVGLQLGAEDKVVLGLQLLAAAHQEAPILNAAGIRITFDDTAKNPGDGDDFQRASLHGRAKKAIGSVEIGELPA